MTIADYLVSFSLQANTECLRHLAEVRLAAAAGGRDTTAGEVAGAAQQTVYAENVLARESRRLTSLWALLPPLVPEDEFTSHRARLERVSLDLAEASSHSRLALRLAAVAVEDDDAAALLAVARAVPGDETVDWDTLNTLFTADSTWWRSALEQVEVSDEQVCELTRRSYRRAYRHARKLFASDAGDWPQGRVAKLARWSQYAAHQLELFRPGLSDKGKAGWWFLDKAADSLRNRSGLLSLRTEIAGLEIPKAQRKLAGACLDQQISKMDRRIEQLCGRGLKIKPRRMKNLLQTSVEHLGLRAISWVRPANAEADDEYDVDDAHAVEMQADEFETSAFDGPHDVPRDVPPNEMN